MNTLLINCNPQTGQDSFDKFLKLYELRLYKAGHYVKPFVMREMHFNSSAGNCAFQAFRRTAIDDTRYISNCLDDIHLIVWAVPLLQGTLPSPVLQLQQRVLACIANRSKHKLADGENLIPLMGMIAEPDPLTTPQKLLRIKLNQERAALDSGTVLSFFSTSGQGITEVLCETFKSFSYHRNLEALCHEMLAS